MPDYNAVPGLANFMEGDEISDEVTKTEDGTTITEETQSAQVADEGSDLVAEGEETSSQVEMICNGFDELERLQAHITKFGISREFVSWYGHDKLAAMLHVQLPSMESIDRIGDPTSVLSIACQEGIGESIKNGALAVWNFIKKVLSGIWAFLQKAVQFIVNFVLGIRKNIGRLRTMWQDRVDDPELAKNRTASFSTLGELETVYKNGGQGLVEACLSIDGWALKKLKAAWNFIGGNANIQDGGESGIDKALIAQINKMDNQAENINKILNGQSAKAESKKRPLAECAWNDVPKLLDLAEGIILKAQKMQDSVKRVQQNTKDAAGISDSMTKMAAKSDKPIYKEKGKNARECVNNMNKIAKSITKVLNYQRKIATQCVKTSALRIANASKKK